MSIWQPGTIMQNPTSLTTRQNLPAVLSCVRRRSKNPLFPFLFTKETRSESKQTGDKKRMSTARSRDRSVTPTSSRMRQVPVLNPSIGDPLDAVASTAAGIGFDLPSVEDELTSIKELSQTINSAIDKNFELGKIKRSNQNFKQDRESAGIGNGDNLKTLADRVGFSGDVLANLELNREVILACQRREGPTVAIEVEHQEAFKTVMMKAARERKMVGKFADSMRWLGRSRESSKGWVRKLQPLLQAPYMCAKAATSLTEFLELVRQFQEGHSPDPQLEDLISNGNGDVTDLRSYGDDARQQGEVNVDDYWNDGNCMDVDY